MESSLEILLKNCSLEELKNYPGEEPDCDIHIKCGKSEHNGKTWKGC